MIRALTALSLLLSLPVYSQSPIITFEADDIIADQTGAFASIIVSASVDVGTENLQGLQLAFGYDVDMLHVVTIQSAAPFNPSFEVPWFFNFADVGGVPGTCGYAALFDFQLVNVIPLSQVPAPVIEITVFAEASASVGGTSSFEVIPNADGPGQSFWDPYLVWGDAEITVVPPLPLTTLNFVSGDPTFVRGDCNGDNLVTLVDAIRILRYAFLGDPPPPCEAAMDIYGDGLDSFTVETLNICSYLFVAGTPAPAQGCLQQDPLGIPCVVETCP